MSDVTIEQTTLFDMTPEWVYHWVGMPEYTHEDLQPRQSLLVHFETEADREAFSHLVRQPIGEKTQSIWYPEAAITRMVDKRYAIA